METEEEEEENKQNGDQLYKSGQSDDKSSEENEI